MSLTVVDEIGQQIVNKTDNPFYNYLFTCGNA